MRVSRIFRVIGWRAWYANGSVFDSKTTKWEDLPPLGLQVVMQYLDEPGYRSVVSGADFYFFDATTGKVRGWKKTLPELLAAFPLASIKTGTLLSNSAYEAVKTRAFAPKEL